MDPGTALTSVRALRACILDDETNGRIGPKYRSQLTELRDDVERILTAAEREDTCGRCGSPLRDGMIFHPVCPL